MRFLAAALFAVTAVVSPAEAGCQTDGVLFFPAPGGVVPTNAHFILEGLGSEAARVTKLSAYDQLTLKSSDDTVTLKITRSYQSERNRAAVELTPATPLRPNRIYTLSLERALKGYTLLHDGSPPLAWKTGSKDDSSVPSYRVKPAVSEGEYQKSGEQLRRFLKVRAVLEENGPAYWVATLQRARGSTAKQVYPVFLRGDEALIGHDECSGSFNFDDGRAYSLSLTLTDSAGNKAPTVTLEVQAPRPLR
ncbi:MAG: hypothetical protein K1X64_17065 [Myxococcaceae bacterium]|nr:hypothetical protein [Myxococcaceae bacterium]